MTVKSTLAKVLPLSFCLVGNAFALGQARYVETVNTIGKSALIGRLIREGKIDASQIKGKWEAFLIQVVASPLPGAASALVIAGSDKRGTIYAIYDLRSEERRVGQ